MLVKYSSYIKNLYSLYKEIDYLLILLKKDSNTDFTKICKKFEYIHTSLFKYAINENYTIFNDYSAFYKKNKLIKKYIINYKYYFFSQKSLLEKIDYIYNKIEKLIKINNKLKHTTIKIYEYNYDYNGGITNNLNSIKKELEDKIALLMIHELKTIPVYGKN
jgi:hypothetical protein